MHNSLWVELVKMTWLRDGDIPKPWHGSLRCCTCTLGTISMDVQAIVGPEDNGVQWNILIFYCLTLGLKPAFKVVGINGSISGPGVLSIWPGVDNYSQLLQ
jgi:hypothetical protein